MGKKYIQLTLEERVEIYRLHAAGISGCQIGALLGRSAATISRELRRNSASTKVWKNGYEPVRAHRLTERRRARGRSHKLARQPELQADVRDRLAMGWSPEQIAGRLAQEKGCPVISHESIYRFIYHRVAQKDYWHHLLPRKKSCRGKWGARGFQSAEKIKHRTGIAQRPETVNQRGEHGHWEADTMMFRDPRHLLLIACERRSRLIAILPQQTKGAEITLQNLQDFFAGIPANLRQSVTFDNGAEFTHHHRLNTGIGMQTYFCDPHKPWQKGSVENAIGRLRRSLPRNTNLAALTQQEIIAQAYRYNNTPRKCLNFLTPIEAFAYDHTTVALQT